MNTPDPVKPTNGNGNSNIMAGNASAFGGAVAVLVVLTFHMKGIDFPAGYEAALGVAISTVFVYGRAILEKLLGVKLP